MKIKSKKISALIIAGFITIGSFGITPAIVDGQSTSNSITRAVTKTQTGTTTANINMRSSSSTKGKVLTTLKKGTKVEIVKKESNGWYKVKYKTKTGYISGKYIKVTTTSTSSTVTKTQTGTTTSNTNMRSSSSTKGKVLATLKKGTKVEIVKKESNGWYKVKYKTKTGYVNGKYLKITTTNNSSTPTKIMQATASLNVRSGAGTKNKIIGTLKKGEKVTVVSTYNGWAKIKYGSGYGYVSASYLKDVATENNSNNGNTNTNTGNNNTNTESNNTDSNDTTTYRKVNYSTLYNALIGTDGWAGLEGSVNTIGYYGQAIILSKNISSSMKDKDLLDGIGIMDTIGNENIYNLKNKEIVRVLNLATNSESTTNAILNDMKSNSKNFTKVYGDLKISIYYYPNSFFIEF